MYILGENMTVFTDDMIVYVENSKETSQNSWN